ncbi:MAG: hypothetical protein R3Y43_03305 [Alphaproteobacteria bacterium]
MININKKTNNRLVLGCLTGLGLLFAGSANADTCTVTQAPSCTSLGFTQTSSSCSDSYIACPFDTSKVFCGGGVDMSEDDNYCYTGYKRDGVRIPGTNLCMNLMDATTPNSKWHSAATPVTSNSLYGWGYFMGFGKSCYGMTCGSVEQDTSWCKTVMGSNWRFPTTAEYSTIFNNKTSLNSLLSGVGAGLSSVAYWTTTENSSTIATYFNMVSGSLGTNRDKSSHGITYLRCVRAY